GAGEQHRFAPSTDLADVLDAARKGWPPAAGDDQASPRALRGVDRPLVTTVAVQFPEKQVPLLFAAAEDVFGGVEPVVHEDRAAVSFGVVAGKKDRVRGEGRVGLPVAVQ